jgi:hypothetical protein
MDFSGSSPGDDKLEGASDADLMAFVDFTLY